MRPDHRELASQLNERLSTFHYTFHSLPGIQRPDRRAAFVAQVIESIRRVQYVAVIRERDVSQRRADPNDDLFDPLKAAIFFQRHGELDEAFWMVFFFVHFGKHRRSGWQYASRVYGCLGDVHNRWDWATTSADPEGFRVWLNVYQDQIRVSGIPGGFGNHRKYQSLDAYSDVGTGAAFETYVQWVGPPRTHVELIAQALDKANRNPRKTFRNLYNSMNCVASFGRTARFDYLAMLGKLRLATIEPDSTYLQGSTGPLVGARLLFGLQDSATQLDLRLFELEEQLEIGMQVLEDALCNWQKHPDTFVPFRG